MGEALCQIHILAFPGISSLIPRKTLWVEKLEWGKQNTAQSSGQEDPADPKCLEKELMEDSSSKSSSSLTASVLEALDCQAQGAPHPFPDSRCTPSPRCVTVGVQLQQEMWKNPSSLLWKSSCLFSLGSNLGSSKEQEFRYKRDASIPESSENPFRCHGAQQGHPDKAQSFLAALHLPVLPGRHRPLAPLALSSPARNNVC